MACKAFNIQLHVPPSQYFSLCLCRPELANTANMASLFISPCLCRWYSFCLARLSLTPSYCLRAPLLCCVWSPFLPTHPSESISAYHPLRCLLRSFPWQCHHGLRAPDVFASPSIWELLCILLNSWYLWSIQVIFEWAGLRVGPYRETSAESWCAGTRCGGAFEWERVCLGYGELESFLPTSVNFFLGRSQVLLIFVPLAQSSQTQSKCSVNAK